MEPLYNKSLEAFFYSVVVNFVRYHIYHIARVSAVSAVLGVPGEAAAESEHPGLHPHPEPLGLRPAVGQRPGREAAEDELLDTRLARETSLARRGFLVRLLQSRGSY